MLTMSKRRKKEVESNQKRRMDGVEAEPERCHDVIAALQSMNGRSIIILIIVIIKHGALLLLLLHLVFISVKHVSLSF